MAIRRTRKQKIQAIKLAQEILPLTLESSEGAKSESKKNSTDSRKHIEAIAFTGNQIGMIYNDLIKTVLISLIMVLLLIGFYIYLR